MAQWRLRNPDTFPPAFHEGMRAGPGEGKLIWVGYTEGGCKRALREWQLFRFSLRGHSSHPSAYWEPRLKHRAEKVQNLVLKRWEIRLTSRRNVMEDLIGMR